MLFKIRPESQSAPLSKYSIGDCIKNDLETVGEEWKTIIDRRNWRLLTEDIAYSKRKVRGRKNIMEKEIMVNSPLTTLMPGK